MRRTRLPRLGLVFACAVVLTVASGAAQPARVPVVLLSIDGLVPGYVLDADRHGVRVPNLRKMVADGASADAVTGVTPTVTYPSHTTLVTGVSPSTHGILNNRPMDPLGTNAGGWYWYAEDIRVPTLWDAAGTAGLVTANVDWPVTVGARIRHNIPQYWRAPIPAPPGGAHDHKLLRALATPGLLDEAERDLEAYPAGYRYALADDAIRARFVAWMVEQKRPDLMTAYFSSLDETQHDTAPFSAETFETLEGLDRLVGQVRGTAERVYGGRFVFAVVSDHGHITASRELHLNAALREAGFIDLDARGRVTAARAYAWSAGGSMAVMLTAPAGRGASDARARVSDLLRTLAADPANGIARVVAGDDIAALAGFGCGLRRGPDAGHAGRGRRHRTCQLPRLPRAARTATCPPTPAWTRRSSSSVPAYARARRWGASTCADIAPNAGREAGRDIDGRRGRNLL
ncbi:MAG: ectonucleotide pyrophosphatase/phosphodiesterase [Vicinamibacterales bacterium]